MQASPPTKLYLFPEPQFPWLTQLSPEQTKELGRAIRLLRESAIQEKEGGQVKVKRIQSPRVIGGFTFSFINRGRLNPLFRLAHSSIDEVLGLGELKILEQVCGW